MTKLLIKIISKKSSPSRKAYALLSGITGIICNLTLCLIKFFVGSFTGSISITADAINNLTDCTSGLMTILSAKLSEKPKDNEHPYGHGRIEYITAFIMGIVIIFVSVSLAKSSVDKIINPATTVMNTVAIAMLVLAIIVKLWMAYFNNKLFKITNNINLKAVKQDSISDCVTTLSTIVALVISNSTSFKSVDGIIGIIVSIFIFLTGVEILKEVADKLIGKSPSQDTIDKIKELIVKQDGITGVHDLVINDYGPDKIIASAHAEVQSNLDIIQIHNSLDKAEKAIKEQMNITITLHPDPTEKK